MANKKKKKKREPKHLRGHILIAAPRLKDPNFARSVVLVIRHDAEGAFGLVLNRATTLAIEAIWRAIRPDGPSLAEAGFAHQGGPVEPQGILALHGFEDVADGGEPVVPGVYLATDVDDLRKAAERAGSAKSPPFRIYCGYAGWGAGQLDSELDSEDWLVRPAEAGHVFGVDPAELWRITVESLGGIYRLVAMMPLDPDLN